MEVFCWYMSFVNLTSSSRLKKRKKTKGNINEKGLHFSLNSNALTKTFFLQQFWIRRIWSVYFLTTTELTEEVYQSKNYNTETTKLDAHEIQLNMLQLG